MNSKLNYETKNYQERENRVNYMLQEDYSVKDLEQMANYLLESDEGQHLKKESKQNVLLTNANWHRQERKERLLSSFSNDDESEDAAENKIFHQQTDSKKIEKKQKITQNDLYKNDETSKVLNEYQDYLNFLRQQPSNQKITRIKSGVLDDQRVTKDILNGVFGYRWNPSNEGDITNVEQFDLSNIDILKGKSLKVKGKIEFQNGLLYYEPYISPDDDFAFLLCELQEIIDNLLLSDFQLEILYFKRLDYTQKEIAQMLGSSAANVSKAFHRLAEKVAKVAGEHKEEERKAA